MRYRSPLVRVASRATVLAAALASLACGGDGGATGPGDVVPTVQTRVSFVRRDSYSGPSRLMIAEIGAVDPRTLSPAGEAVGAFSWSPDGRAAYAVNGTGAIATVSADGTGHRLLVRGMSSDAVFVAWSPNGRWLAFNDGPALVVLDVRGTSAAIADTLPQTDIWFPVWSPDSKRIAFSTSGARIGVLDVTSHATTLFTLPGYAAHPTWHPDGTEIAYDDGRQIWTVNADGSEPRAVPVGCPSNAACIDRQYEYPHWSPDGLRFAAHVYGTAEVALLTADGSDLRVVSTGVSTYTHPSWSRDGRVVFLANHTSSQKPYVMNADGSGLTAVTSGASFDDMPQWVP